MSKFIRANSKVHTRIQIQPMKKYHSILVFSLYICFVNLAQANMLDDAEKLLIELHTYECQMRRPSTSMSERTAIHIQHVETSSKLTPITMGIMSDVNSQKPYRELVDRIQELPCTDSAGNDEAETAAKDIDSLLEEYGRLLCVTEGPSDVRVDIQAFHEANRLKKEIDYSIELLRKSGDRSKSDAIRAKILKLHQQTESGC